MYNQIVYTSQKPHLHSISNACLVLQHRKINLFISGLIVLCLVFSSYHAIIIFIPIDVKGLEFDQHQEVIGLRQNFELKIEVDYFQDLLWPEVIDSFDFLISYFEARGIPTEVNFNSSNNVIIDSNGYISDQEMWRSIERQYHDNPQSHVYFIIAHNMGDPGLASPLYGAGISLDLIEKRYENIRHVIMHEMGHCIGIGLHDDGDETETYSANGFMSVSPSQANYTAEYNVTDWNDAFAPDGTFGNSTRKTARIWNRYSIVGEIFDDTSDVIGTVIGDIEMPEWGLSMILTNKENGVYFTTAILPYQRNFTIRAKPGQYVLELQEPYVFDKPQFVNVSGHDTLMLGNLTVGNQENEPLYNEIVIFSSTSIIVISISVSIHLIKKKKKKTIE
jgi:hypothetical protein